MSGVEENQGVANLVSQFERKSESKQAETPAKPPRHNNAKDGNCHRSASLPANSTLAMVKAMHAQGKKIIMLGLSGLYYQNRLVVFSSILDFNFNFFLSQVVANRVLASC